MNDLDVNRVLSQIRAMQAQATARPAAADAIAPGGGFATLLRNAIDNVNQSQLDAGAKQSAFETGDSATDLTSVMLASAKAQVSFKAMVEVRNRLVNAYQEIMNMPI